MTNFVDSVIGITGASGHLGRATIRRLHERGARKIVALTRDPAKVADLTGLGVETRQASFDDPASMDRAFAGVERLLIVSTDDVTIPGGRHSQHVRAIDAAERAGVAFVAYTSVTSPYPDAAPEAAVANDHFWTENRLFAGPFDAAALRNNLYTDYLLPAANAALASGAHYHAAAGGARALVTRDDCAAAAAGAMLTATGKQIFDISGPAAISQDELARLFAQYGTRPVRAVAVPIDQFVAGAVAGGVPEGFARVLARFDRDTALGRLAVVTDDVERLSGRRPRSVAEFLAGALARAA